MSTRKLSNVSIAEFETFLDLAQCKFVGVNGGHNKWTRSDLYRPIIFQTHIEPIPEFIVRNLLRIMSYSKADYFDILECRKKVFRNVNRYTLQ